MIKRFPGPVVKSKDSQKVRAGIFTSGEILTDYKAAFLAEQALIVKTSKGLVILTGCAHPGIVRIVKHVKQQFPRTPIHLVAGGFHLMNADKRMVSVIADELMRLGVKKVGPTHCTGDDAEKIFQEKFGKAFVKIRVGTLLPTP